MSRVPVKAIVAVAAFVFLAWLVPACSRGAGQAAPGDAVVGGKDSAAGSWIELKRRNWESNGTDTRIESDGSYTVSAIYMRTSKEVRKGRISKSDSDKLARQMKDAQLFDMKDKYSAPFKSEWSWWGYVLTVKTGQGTKSIRFHSEDDTVPEHLKRIVESIMEMTK